MFLRDQVEIYNSLDGGLVEAAAFSGADFELVKLGVDSVMRASVVKGLMMFTDFDELSKEIVTEDEENGQD